MKLIDLFESFEINLSKKIFATLSADAKNAIDRWESTNWTDGPLEKAIKSNDSIAKELYEAFTPIRNLLKRKGNSIKLYRGVSNNHEEFDKKKFLFSWTDDEKVAEHFAGRRTTNWKKLVNEPITDEQIQHAVKEYNKRGFVSFRSKLYIRDKNGDDLKDFSGNVVGAMNIYTKDRNHITGVYGNELESLLKDDQDYINEYNQKLLSRGKVLVKMIPVNDIIWLTNNLNSKEYIVKGNH